MIPDGPHVGPGSVVRQGSGARRERPRVPQSTPLVRRLRTHPAELAAIARRVRPEDLAAKARSLLPLREFVVAAQARGCLTPADPDVVVGVIRAATLLTLHRDDIGVDVYDDVLDLLIASLARGLTTDAPPSALGGPP